MTGIEATLVRVLAEHREIQRHDGTPRSGCYGCARRYQDETPLPADKTGRQAWLRGANALERMTTDDYRTHVAMELAAALRADETLVERVARLLFAAEQCDKRQARDLEANWGGRLSDADRDEYRDLARAALAAAAEHRETL